MNGLKWEREVAIELSVDELLRYTGKVERFWMMVVQRLIDEGADIEFFYDEDNDRMDFCLRGPDRLIYDRDFPDRTLTFKWQRATAVILTGGAKGLSDAGLLNTIDFITDHELGRLSGRD